MCIKMKNKTKDNEIVKICETRHALNGWHEEEGEKLAREEEGYIVETNK